MQSGPDVQPTARGEVLMQRYAGAYPRPSTGPRVDHALPVDKT